LLVGRKRADVDLVLLMGVHREVVVRTCGICLGGLFGRYGNFRGMV
jgi:hypothetical protein